MCSFRALLNSLNAIHARLIYKLEIGRSRSNGRSVIKKICLKKNLTPGVEISFTMSSAVWIGLQHTDVRNRHRPTAKTALTRSVAR